jgi:hypothetical protein
MSYINFLGCGAQGNQTTYRRDSYKPDTVQSIGTSHSYKGNTVIQVPQSKTVKEVVIDQAVKVTTVADQVRSDAQELWSGLRTGCLSTFSFTLIVAIGGGVAATLVGVFMPILWPVALAVGIVALIILGFSIWNLCRGIEAKGELNEWEDPLPDFQQKRREIEQKGFYPAYSSNYLGKYVSQEELGKLWFVSMDKWNENYENDLKFDHLKVSNNREFMEQCPLKKGAMDYTFGISTKDDTEEMALLRGLSSKYGALKGQYDTIRQQTESLKSKIREEKRSKLLENDHWLNQSLAPYEALLYSQKMALLAQQTQYKQTITVYESSVPAITYHSTIGHHGYHHLKPSQPYSITPTFGGHVVVGSGHGYGHLASIAHTPIVIPHHVVVARSNLLEITAKLARIELIYNSMTAPIRAVHAKNASKVKAWADCELNKIQASEDSTLLKFYPPIKALLNAYKNRNLKIEEDDEIHAEVELPVNPEAPEIRDEYEVPAYDPSWKEFVGEVDWKNGIVKKTVIEHKGQKTVTTSKTTFAD